MEAPSAPSSFSGKLTSHFSANALQGFAENPNAVKTVIAEEQKKIEISGTFFLLFPELLPSWDGSNKSEGSR